MMRLGLCSHYEVSYTTPDFCKRSPLGIASAPELCMYRDLSFAMLNCHIWYTIEDGSKDHTWKNVPVMKRCRHEQPRQSFVSGGQGHCCNAFASFKDLASMSERL